MNEIGMSSIDEGVSLNQLIPLYIKYRIRYHCVDFKYHKTASHNDHDYKPNTNYPVLFYMVERSTLIPNPKIRTTKSNITNKNRTENIAS